MVRMAADGNTPGATRVVLTMVRAVFDGVVVAESDDVRVVEGMSYFPIRDVDMAALVESPSASRCIWKGKAHYWHVQGENRLAVDSAFAYARPWPLARRLVTDRVAFWRDVGIAGT